MLKSIAEHTIDIDILSNGYVLDAGCRNFTFSKEMRKLGCIIIAIDPDPEVLDPKLENVIFDNIAIADCSGDRALIMTADPQARYLSAPGDIGNAIVRAYTISQIMSKYNIVSWDIVKLDVEGCEYKILDTWPGPIAKQITVEFHEHCLGKQPDYIYKRILDKLSSFGYVKVKHERSAMYGAGLNYWDSLWMLK